MLLVLFVTFYLIQPSQSYVKNSHVTRCTTQLQVVDYLHQLNLAFAYEQLSHLSSLRNEPNLALLTDSIHSTISSTFIWEGIDPKEVLTNIKLNEISNDPMNMDTSYLLLLNPINALENDQQLSDSTTSLLTSAVDMNAILSKASDKAFKGGSAGGW